MIVSELIKFLETCDSCSKVFISESSCIFGRKLNHCLALRSEDGSMSVSLIPEFFTRQGTDSSPIFEIGVKNDFKK